MKKKKHTLTIILYLILFSLICSIIIIYYFEKNLGKNLITCAENEVKRITTLVINNSIKEYTKNIDLNNILVLSKNSNEEITYIHYDTKKINELTTTITKILEKDLQNMTIGNFKEINLKLDNITKEYYEKINDGIILTIPLGSATGNSLLSNIGPKIPLKLKIVDNINTTIKSKVTEYGLNNAMIELYIEITTKTNIQMPFTSKEITIKNKIPITTEIIQGIVPNYYLNNK